MFFLNIQEDGYVLFTTPQCKFFFFLNKKLYLFQFLIINKLLIKSDAWGKLNLNWIEINYYILLLIYAITHITYNL